MTYKDVSGRKTMAKQVGLWLSAGVLLAGFTTTALAQGKDASADYSVLGGASPLNTDHIDEANNEGQAQPNEKLIDGGEKALTSGVSLRKELYPRDGGLSTWGEFSRSVDVSNNVVVVSNYSEDFSATHGDLPGESQGAVYIYARHGDSWHQEARLTKKSALPAGVSIDLENTRFGNDVAIDGNLLAISSNTHGCNGMLGCSEYHYNDGGVFLFERVDNQWQSKGYLIPPSNLSAIGFGVKLEMSGNTLLVAHQWQGIHYYSYVAGQWVYQSTLANPVMTEYETLFYPSSMSISGNRVAVGAANSGDHGVVYLFRKSGSQFVSHQVINAPPAIGQYDAEVSSFGQDVNLKSNDLIVTAPTTSGCDQQSCFGWSGAVFTYRSSSETAQMVAGAKWGGLITDNYGTGVDIASTPQGDFLLIPYWENSSQKVRVHQRAIGNTTWPTTPTSNFTLAGFPAGGDWVEIFVTNEAVVVSDFSADAFGIDNSGWASIYAPSYKMNYTASGLSGQLQINTGLPGSAGVTRTISAGASGQLTDTIYMGDAYNVTIVSQPANQICSITNGSGVVGTANITFGISCVAKRTVTAVVANNAGGSISPAIREVANGATTTFTLAPFAGWQIQGATGCAGSLSGTTYTTGAVTANCTVTATFSRNTYTVGGSTTGLVGSGLVLGLTASGQANQTRAISANGSFTFATPVPFESTYNVAVVTQPSSPKQTCSVTNGSGTIGAGNVTGVAVSCVTDTHLVSTSVAGNGTISPSSATVPDMQTASFTLTPSIGWQIQGVAGCGGSLSGTTYTTGAVTANCTVTATFSRNTYTVGGSTTGLVGSGLVLGLTASGQANQTRAISANGSFTFATPVPFESTYNVTVVTQPSSPKQTCSVTNGSGTIGTGNVTGVAVSCETDTHLVSTSVVGNGTISPSSTTVPDMQTASFTLAPSIGWQIEGATGCGGTLSGSTYTTAAVTDACQIVATFYSTPHQVAIVGGQDQEAKTHLAFASPITVRVTNAAGEAIVGETVQFALQGNSAVLNQSSAVTNAQGEASVNATATAVMGSSTVVASVGALNSSVVTLVTLPRDIDLELSGEQQSVAQYGQTMRYDIALGNAGADDAIDVTLKFTLGGALTAPAVFHCYRESEVACSVTNTGNVYTLTFDELPSSDVLLVTLEATIDSLSPSAETVLTVHASSEGVEQEIDFVKIITLLSDGFEDQPN